MHGSHFLLFRFLLYLWCAASIQSTRQLESKVNKVYKTLSREITKGKGDREGLWGSLSELSCRISEIRSQIE